MALIELRLAPIVGRTSAPPAAARRAWEEMQRAGIRDRARFGFPPDTSDEELLKLYESEQRRQRDVAKAQAEEAKAHEADEQMHAARHAQAQADRPAPPALTQRQRAAQAVANLRTLRGEL